MRMWRGSIAASGRRTAPLLSPLLPWWHHSGRNVPSELERFIERHAGRDRQLTLLAY